MPLGGYSRLRVYVTDRDQVMDTFEWLDTMTFGDIRDDDDRSFKLTPALKNVHLFLFDDKYREAITRMHFVFELTELIKPIYILVLSVVLGIVVLAQLGVTIDHRREKYGMARWRRGCRLHRLESC